MMRVDTIINRAASINIYEGDHVERSRDKNITGWYVDEHGVPPFPVPESLSDQEGAWLLRQEDFWAAVFRDDDGIDEPLSGVTPPSL